MKKINNKFILVGTNPYIHIKEFYDWLNKFKFDHKFYISSKNINGLQDNSSLGEFVFKKSGKSAFEQYYRAWINFGFVKKNNNLLIKICDEDLDVENLIEIAKINLFLNSKDEKIENYKNTILVKLLYCIDVDKVISKKFYTNKNRLVSE